MFPKPLVLTWSNEEQISPYFLSLCNRLYSETQLKLPNSTIITGEYRIHRRGERLKHSPKAMPASRRPVPVIRRYLIGVFRISIAGAGLSKDGLPVQKVSVGVLKTSVDISKTRP